MLFESQHSIGEEEFRMSNGRRMSFPLHTHRSFEYFAQISGCSEVVIDGKKYVVNEGSAVLIFPFQFHSYTSLADGRYEMCIFYPDMVPDFYKKTEHLQPTDNLFPRISEEAQTDNIFIKKAFAYRICGEFDRDRSYRENDRYLSHDVLTDLLMFADKNFRGNCMLRDAAAAIGYDYAYISKYFKRKVGVSFRQYVSLLRVRESKHLLASTSKSISQIMSECGFQCLRTFDREFLSVTGITPSEFRKEQSRDSGSELL